MTTKLSIANHSTAVDIFIDSFLENLKNSKYNFIIVKDLFWDKDNIITKYLLISVRPLLEFDYSGAEPTEPSKVLAYRDKFTKGLVQIFLTKSFGINYNATIKLITNIMSIYDALFGFIENNVNFIDRVNLVINELQKCIDLQDLEK